MRPLLPIAAAILLATGAAALPALTQAQDSQTSAKHYKWKKTNIDVAAMSASMAAQNPNAFSPTTTPSTGNAATDQQPGAINSTATSGAMSSDSQPIMGNSATTGAQNSPASPPDDPSMTAPNDKSMATPPAGSSASSQ